jgi:hypothetical protein
MTRQISSFTRRELLSRADPSGLCTDAAAIIDIAALFGLQPASEPDIEEGLRIVASRVDSELASLATITAVQRGAPASILVHRPSDKVAGMLGIVQLDAAGLQALRDGRLDTRNLPANCLLQPGQTPAAGYVWIVAATCPASGRALLQGAAAIRATLMWRMLACARAVTPDGMRVMSSFGFQHASGPLGYMEQPPPGSPLHQT